MKRLLVLAALAVAFQASPASAQFIKLSGTPGCGKGSGNQPPPLGPWYNYWPLEAHFQVPAMPEYPFFGAPQTVPVTPPAPYSTNGMNGLTPGNGMGFGGGYPGMVPYGGYPGMMPYTNGAGAPAL